MICFLNFHFLQINKLIVLYSISIGYGEVSIICNTVDAVDCDSVITCWEVIIGSAGVAVVVITIYKIIWCASAVITLKVDSTGRTEIDCEFIKPFIVGHLGRVKVD